MSKPMLGTTATFQSEEFKRRTSKPLFTRKASDLAMAARQQDP